MAVFIAVLFHWLSYADGSITAVKKMPTVFIYTMNATEEQAGGLVRQQTSMGEQLFQWAFGGVHEAKFMCPSFLYIILFHDIQVVS